MEDILSCAGSLGALDSQFREARLYTVLNPDMGIGLGRVAKL